MKEIIILRGLPFSGKTTWAEKLKERKKDIALFNIEKVLAFDMDKPRAIRWAIVKEKLNDVIKNNNTIVIDDINILSSNIKRLIEMLDSYAMHYNESFIVSIKVLHTPYKLCEKRAISANIDEHDMKILKHFYNHCLRREIIYNNEKDS